MTLNYIYCARAVGVSSSDLFSLAHSSKPKRPFDIISPNETTLCLLPCWISHALFRIAFAEFPFDANLFAIDCVGNRAEHEAIGNNQSRMRETNFQLNNYIAVSAKQ